MASKELIKALEKIEDWKLNYTETSEGENSRLILEFENLGDGVAVKEKIKAILSSSENKEQHTEEETKQHLEELPIETKLAGTSHNCELKDENREKLIRNQTKKQDLVKFQLAEVDWSKEKKILAVNQQGYDLGIIPRNMEQKIKPWINQGHTLYGIVKKRIGLNKPNCGLIVKVFTQEVAEEKREKYLEGITKKVNNSSIFTRAGVSFEDKAVYVKMIKEEKWIKYSDIDEQTLRIFNSALKGKEKLKPGTHFNYNINNEFPKTEVPLTVAI